MTTVEKIYNYGSNHKTAIKLAGIGATAAVIGGLGYYFISQETGPSGGACNKSGTPCYTAIEPYKKLYNACFASWQTVNNAILKQGYATSEQSALLEQYAACMDKATKNIATTVKGYTPQNALTTFITVMQPVVYDAVLIVSGSIAASIFIKTIAKTGFRSLLSSSATRQASEQATIKAQVQTDSITQEEAQNSLKVVDNEAADIEETQASVEEEVSEIGDILDLSDEEVTLAVSTTEDVIVSAEAYSEVEDVLLIAGA